MQLTQYSYMYCLQTTVELTPMTPEAETLAPPINAPTTADISPALPIDDTPDEWHVAWSEDKLYDIVGARF